MNVITADMAKLGYLHFDWNVNSADTSSVTPPKEVIVNAVLNGAKGKTSAIILMHDSALKTTTAAALPEIIDGLIAQGFIFDTLSETSFIVQFIKALPVPVRDLGN